LNHESTKTRKKETTEKQAIRFIRLFLLSCFRTFAFS